MKSNFKKLTAITLSSLGILASAPSAFCAPKACPSSAKKNNNITNAPKKHVQTDSSKTKVISNRIISKKLIGCKFTQKHLKAPNATFIYDGAFSDQPNLKKISYKCKEGVEKYFSKKLRKRKTLSEVDLPLKASVLTV